MVSTKNAPPSRVDDSAYGPLLDSEPNVIKLNPRAVCSFQGSSLVDGFTVSTKRRNSERLSSSSVQEEPEDETWLVWERYRPDCSPSCSTCILYPERRSASRNFAGRCRSVTSHLLLLVKQGPTFITFASSSPQ